MRAADQVLLFDAGRGGIQRLTQLGVSYREIDAVFLTHPHADHIFGFDDVRRFSTLQEQHIPVYGSSETIRMMRTKFEYVDKGYNFESVPRVRFMEQVEPVSVGDATVTPLPVSHGKDTIYGFLVESDGKRLGYIPDCNGIPDKTLGLLANLDAMILDGLRPQEHPTHFTIDEAAEMLGRIGARQSFITHLTHNSEHHELQARLGDAVTVPWDGLSVELQ